MKTAKTKILVTVGPASNSPEIMSEMIALGTDAFRLNFSHGNKDYFEEVFNNIDDACRRRSAPASILVDLQGPKIRVGELKSDFVELKKDSVIRVTIEDIRGDEKRISTSYKDLVKDANIGDFILIDDGLLKLQVTGKKGTDLICKIINGGILKPRKGMNLPGMEISAPALTEKDKENLEFALKHRVDFVALSFVRKAEDILMLRDWLKERNKIIPIIAKIEKPEAVHNFDSILKVADGVMVARGDLGVEMTPQDVPVIQKNIIRKCMEVGKLAITATQMLESMINNPVPTRAEASDVANAVFDGTHAVMLSGETSVGKYPIKTVAIMHDLIYRAEKERQFLIPVEFKIPDDIIENLFDSTGKSAVNIAKQVGAKAIIVFTHHGRKARVIAKFNPSVPVFAFSDNLETLNRLNLYKGIIPLYMGRITSEKEAVREAKKKLRQYISAETGDVFVFTAGAPITDKGRKSWIHFEII